MKYTWVEWMELGLDLVSYEYMNSIYDEWCCGGNPNVCGENVRTMEADEAATDLYIIQR